MCNPSLDATTTSLPHGEMDMDPIGCSRWKEMSLPNVSLSNADLGLMDSEPSSGLVIFQVAVPERSLGPD
jgi:hypothetical protein